MPDDDDKCVCPHCGRQMDTYPAEPHQGDAAICFACVELSVFTGEGCQLRCASEMEREELLLKPEVTDAMAMVLDTKLW